MTNKLIPTNSGIATANACVNTTATISSSNTKRKLASLPASLAYLANPPFDTVTVPNRFFHPIIMFETVSVARLVWYIFSQNQNGVEYVEASYTELEKALNLSRSAIHQAINRSTMRGYIERLDTRSSTARSRFAINWQAVNDACAAPAGSNNDGGNNNTTGEAEPLPFEEDGGASEDYEDEHSQGQPTDAAVEGQKGSKTRVKMRRNYYRLLH